MEISIRDHDSRHQTKRLAQRACSSPQSQPRSTKHPAIPRCHLLCIHPAPSSSRCRLSSLPFHQHRSHSTASSRLARDMASCSVTAALALTEKYGLGLFTAAPQLTCALQTAAAAWDDLVEEVSELPLTYAASISDVLGTDCNLTHLGRTHAKLPA